MTYDTGFSSMKTILGRNAAIQAKDLIPEIPAILPGHIAKFISLKKSGFSNYEVFFKCLNFIGYIAIK